MFSWTSGLQKFLTNFWILVLVTLEKFPMYGNVTYLQLDSVMSFWGILGSVIENFLFKNFLMHLSINLHGYRFFKKVFLSALKSRSRPFQEELILKVRSKSVSISRFLYVKGTKLLKLVNNPVYVDLWKTDVLSPFLLQIIMSKNGRTPFSFSSDVNLILGCLSLRKARNSIAFSLFSKTAKMSYT